MSSGWVDRPGRGVAKYQFLAKDDNQLSMNVGDIVEVKQENSGWYRGYFIGQPTPQLKLFPVSYVNFTPQAELDAQGSAVAPAAAPSALQTATSTSIQTQTSPQQLGASTPRSQFGAGTFGHSTPSRGGGLLAQAQAGSQQQAGGSFFTRQQAAQPSQFLQQHQQQQQTSAQLQPFQQQGSPLQQQPASPSSPQFSAATLQPAAQTVTNQPFVLGQQQNATPLSSQTPSQQPSQDVNTIRGYSSTGGIPTYNPEPKSKAPTDMNTLKGFSSTGGVPTYNPEPKGKSAAPAAATSPSSSNTLHFPAIFLDNRPQASDDKENQGNQELGYVLPKSRDGVRALQGNLDNIVEVLDSYKLVDPLSAQHMLIEDGTSPYRANGQAQSFDDYNSSLLQVRHAQHQSLTLSTDSSLRDTDTSSIVKLKKGPYDKTENRASHSTISSLFPTFDSTNEYISGECSLPPKRYQLFLNVNVCIFAVNEWTELYFSLYSHQQHRYLTEDYVVRLPPPGLPEHATILGRMKTIFRDLSPEDLKADLWLVCRIYRNGSLLVDKKTESQAFSGKKDEKGKGLPTVRRCFGCAATYVSQANLTSQIGKKYEPPTNQLTIFVPTNENTFATFHEALILRGKGLVKDSREFDTVPRAKGIALALTLYEGEIEQVREQNRSALKEVTETMKLQLPTYWDIRLPRTELQITLNGCVALQDKKASAKNIEIRVKLVSNSNYQEVTSAIYRGNGASDEEPSPSFTTSVYYHTNTPVFNEMFKIRCPPQVLQECHLMFELWHVSTNPKKSACFSTAHMCITAPSKTNGPPRFILDQEHTITTYKPYGKDDNYLNPSAALKLLPRKGESLTFTTQLLSTSLTSQGTLAELRNWQTASQQRCTQLLNGLVLTSKSQPITSAPSATPSSLGSFGSPLLSTSAGGDEPLVYIPTRQLRQNMQDVLNVFLQILSANDRIALHGIAFDSFVHVLSRLTVEAKPMLDLYVNQLIRPDFIPALWRLLGFTLGALEYYEHFVVTSVEAINAAGGQGPIAAAGGGAGNNGSNAPQTPLLKDERRPSAIPQFTLMSGTDLPNKSIPQAPSTPSHRSQGSKMDFDDGSAEPSHNGKSGASSSSHKLANDDLTPLNRFTFAFPYLLRIIVPLFAAFERTNQAQHLRQAVSNNQPYHRTQFSEIPASQTGGSTPFIQIQGDGMVREEFKLRVIAMLDKVYSILGQNVATDQAKAILMSQSTLLRAMPELLAVLSYDNAIAPYTQLLAPEDLVSSITQLLTSITANASLSIDEMGAIKTFLTGIVGSTGQAPDAMNTAVPLVHHLDSKNIHSVTAIGWHRHTVSSLRSWISTPKQYRAFAISTPVLKALLPQFLSSIQACVTAAIYRGSLNEALLAIPVIEHIYSLIFAANRAADDISAVYVQELHSFYLSGSRFSPLLDSQNDPYDISSKTPSEVFPPSTYLQLLPILITILYNYVALHPKIDLPKSDTTHRPFQLPEWRVINSTLVDLMPQAALMIFSIFSLTPKEDVVAYFTQALPGEQSANLLAQLLGICNGLTTFAIVPKVWLDLDVFQRTSIISIVRVTSEILLEKFNTAESFHSFAWVYWLQLALSCKGPDFFNIQGSNFRAGHINSKVDRPAVERELISLFHVMWAALTPAHKVTTSPVLVERLIAIVSSPLSDDEYKTLALHIYYELLESEFSTTKSFSFVERYTIDSLYEVANISPDRAHAAMDKMYNATWAQFDSLALADPMGTEQLTSSGRKFLDHLKNLFTLMSSLFTHPSDPEWEYDRTAVALRLIRYIENSAKAKEKSAKEKEELEKLETASSSSSSSNTANSEVDNEVQTRKAMHTRYIQYLVDLHVDHRNFAEAGISYIQQAKQLDWTQTMLDGSGTDFQPETESDRKVRLLDAAIDAFSKAHDYERCIQLIDYLRYYHQHITFNFSALAKQIQRQANFFNAMLGTTRVYSTYYRVVLYGRAAQDALQSAGNQLSNPNHTPENGVEFVYKGNTLEGISLFTDRLKKRFTDAFFHMSSDRPTPEMMAQHKSIVAIVALVVPPPETRSEVLSGCMEAKHQYEQARLAQDPTMIAWQWPQANGYAQQAAVVNNAYQLGTQTAIPTDALAIAHSHLEPPTVINYRTNNRIYVFEYSKPWRRGEDKKPANEFLDLWLIRTYLIVEEPFPANRRRIEVIARVEKIQKPVQNAVEQVQNKTKELSTLIQEVMATPHGEIADTRKLSMILNGMIDAPVNGGNAKYIEAFLSPQFATAEAVIFDTEKADLQATLSERRKCQQELKTAFKQQFAILKEGVAIFERKADSSQLALIQHLKATYDATMVKLAPILD